MKLWTTAFLVVVVPGALFLTSCSRADDLPDRQRWWAHVTFLADDKLEGRNTGSPGHLRAAEYVATEFAHAGLKPAVVDGYLQSVPLVSMEIDENTSSLTLVKEAGTESLILGRDAVINLQVDPASTVEADLVFAGYGLSIPEANHDDFAGLEVRGKLVVYLFGAPPALTGALGSHIQSPVERATVFHRHSAVGSVCVLRADMGGYWTRLAAARLRASMKPADPSMDESLNVDMFLPLFPLKNQTIDGLDESELGVDASAVARSLGVAPQADLEPERYSFVRSDQYSFIRRGIPSLALRVGYDKGSHEEAIATRWRAVRYHAPSDDLAQPVDKHAAGAFNELVVKLLERIANREDRPRWHELSFFKRFAR